MLKKKDILITSLGNILEWFDFGLFIFLAPLLGEKFFPIHDEKAAVLATFGVFAAGYLCRPLGGILFGHFGDTQGRIKTLRSSILVMTMTTLIIGCLPEYKTIGIFAALLFTLMRMLQGISIGGEYAGVMIYLAESAPTEKRGFITSFAGCGANFGFMLATLVALSLKFILPSNVLDAWGWRIPFFLVGLLGFIIFYFRFNLPETTIYQTLKEKNCIDRKPLLDAFRFFPKNIFQIIGLTCMSASFYIIFFGYMPRYLSETTSMTLNTAMSIQSISLLFTLFCIPLAGMLGDRYGRKNMLLLTSFMTLLFLSVCFYLLHQQQIIIMTLVLISAAILTSLDQGNNLATFVENSPVEVRYSSIAFAYNFGNALFGGLIPLLCALLVVKLNVFAPAYLLIITTTIGFLTILTLKKREFSAAG